MGDVGRFNRWAPTYDRHLLQRLVIAPVHRAVLDAARGARAPARVLDVGCGTGRLLEQTGLRWPYSDLVGVDPASAMIEVARARFGTNPHVQLEVASAEHLPLPDRSVDVAFSTVSSHHWDDPAAGLREIARVLAPGGRMLLADFRGGGLFRGTLAPLWTRVRRAHVPRHFHSPDAIRAMFEAAGLRVAAQRPLRSRGLGLHGPLLLTIGELPTAG